ncbi:MAG: hypothetical protein U1E45_12315 [Geminicoccaceae bacterium]
MAVLVEAISVVIRIDALLPAFGGALDAFRAEVPNDTLCADRELARVGFMVPDDTRQFVERLAGRGLVYLADGKARDLVVVDQQRGPAVACDWIEFGHVAMDGDPSRRVACCRLAGSKQTTLATPPGWSFERSLSSSFGFSPTAAVPQSLDFLRHERGFDVYRSRLTGEEVFVGRVCGPMSD